MNYIVAILKIWKCECHYNNTIQFDYSYSTGILTIYTPYPGYLIGKAGYYVNKYENILKNEISKFSRIEFKQVEDYIV